MAGHSQFKNIMYRKGAQDAKKARAFAKIIREIMVSAKMSPDPNSNPRLRAALASARAANMPKDNVDRAIKKAIGNDADSNFSEVRYEGYGPAGIAIIVETLTDNRNRTASEIRAAFSKHGGSLGETNSVAFSFEHCGYLRFSKDKNFDIIFEKALDVGAENVEAAEEGIEVTCAVEDFAAVRDGLVDAIGDAEESKLIWRPNNTAPINDFDTAKTLIKLIDILEDNDDVQNVYANFDISADILEKLAMS